MLKLAEHGNERRQWTNMVNKLTNASIAKQVVVAQQNMLENGFPYEDDRIDLQLVSSAVGLMSECQKQN